MKKRAFERIPVNLELRCFNIDYFGTATNVSENGIFIRSKKIRFPLDSRFVISFHLREETLKVPVKISRITKSNGYYDGIGVELLRSPSNYVKLINRLRDLSRSRKLSSKRET